MSHSTSPLGSQVHPDSALPSNRPALRDRAEDAVVEANRQLLLNRSRVGVAKYGTTLSGAGLTHAQLLLHALEEALDLANYLQAAIRVADFQQGSKTQSAPVRAPAALTAGEQELIVALQQVAIAVTGSTSSTQADVMGAIDALQDADFEKEVALWWALYHSQGGSSPVGQPIRKILGIGQHDPLPQGCIDTAKRWAEGDIKLSRAPVANAGGLDIDAMVNRFLGWPLPDGLTSGVDRPIGTHLMNAEQARAMFAHCTHGQPRPTDDHLWNETIRDRDTYHEWADKLAEAIAKHFGMDIGEHSNANLPWAEALDGIENADRAPAADAGEVTPTDREIMEEWDRHYLPDHVNEVPFLRTVVKFARHWLGQKGGA